VASPAAGELYIGLMSGTSLDGVDAALARIVDQGPMQCQGFVSLAMPPALKAELSALQQPGPDELARAAQAAAALADLYGQAVQVLLEKTHLDATAIRAIGAHGQTVRHRPEAGYTIQLLDGARLAERTGIDTICDFRSADVAAQGQGAPLVPAFHAGVFGDPTRARAIVNIGGIANVSLLIPGKPVRGWDTGAGNTLLDAWCARHLGQDFDADGQWAASAQPDARLLAKLLAQPYFERKPPKSTGRDLFNLPWLDARLAEHAAQAGSPLPPPAVVQSTLTEWVAQTIARDCLQAGVDDIIICGGGRRNAELMRRLAARCAPIEVAGSETLGIDPQAVEALAFAWLADRRIRGAAGNLPEVTGASGPRVLGAWHARPPRAS
jgi:anhydro-N-acetylmuramic acid kinase